MFQNHIKQRTRKDEDKIMKIIQICKTFHYLNKMQSMLLGPLRQCILIMVYCN